MKFVVMHHTITTCKSFLFNFDICLTTFYWFLRVFAAANQNLGTVIHPHGSFNLQMHETSGELLQFDWPFETGTIRSCQKVIKN